MLSLQGTSQSAEDDGKCGLEATKVFPTPANPPLHTRPAPSSHSSLHGLTEAWIPTATILYLSAETVALCLDPSVHAQPFNILPKDREYTVHFRCKWTNYIDRMELRGAGNLVSHLVVRAETVSVITARQINPYLSACVVAVTGLMNSWPSFKHIEEDQINEWADISLGLSRHTE